MIKIRLTALGAILLCSLFLMAAAIYNGFPLIYYDTGTYLESSFTFEVPKDRPIGYGFFIRLTGLNKSLWPVSAVQAFILVFVVYKLFSLLAPGAQGSLLFFSCSILSGSTSLPWGQGQIMPDAFTAIMVLSLLLLLLRAQKMGNDVLVFSVIFVFSNTVHVSHLLISSFVIAAVCVSRLVFNMFLCIQKKAIARTMALLCGAWLAIPVINYGLGDGFYLSKTSHVWMMGRLWESGILKRFLEEKCLTENYSLCAYKDEIRGPLTDFMWKTDSPFHKTGGWDNSEDEYKKIIKESIKSYPLMHIKAALYNFGKQLCSFKIGGDWLLPLSNEYYAYHVIKSKFPNEFTQFLNSRQEKGQLCLKTINFVQRSAVITSALVIIFCFCFWRGSIGAVVRFVVFFILTAVVANAVSCGVFSVVANRYGARVIWLIPFCCIILLTELFRK